MKYQTLNMAQMEHLRQLGVDTGKASVVLLFFDEDGNELGWEVENFGKTEPVYQYYNEESEIWESTNAQYFDAETGHYDHSYRDSCGVFTLQDIIELLPCDIFGNYNFWLLKAKGGYKFSIKNNPDSAKIGTHFYNSPLDAAYDILCWYLANKQK
jgi:hypothetical protein